MNKRTRPHLSLLVRTSLFAACLVVQACGEPTPIDIVKLEITEASLYKVDGQPVAKELLLERLRTRKKVDQTLLLHIVASPSANAEVVIYATKVAGEAGASVAFVGNEKF